MDFLLTTYFSTIAKKVDCLEFQQPFNEIRHDAINQKKRKFFALSPESRIGAKSPREWTEYLRDKYNKTRDDPFVMSDLLLQTDDIWEIEFEGSVNAFFNRFPHFKKLKFAARFSMYRKFQNEIRMKANPLWVNSNCSNGKQRTFEQICNCNFKIK